MREKSSYSLIQGLGLSIWKNGAAFFCMEDDWEFHSENKKLF